MRIGQRNPLQELERATEVTLAQLHEAVGALIQASAEHAAAVTELKEAAVEKKTEEAD